MTRSGRCRQTLSRRVRAKARPHWRGQVATSLLFVGVLGAGWNLFIFSNTDPAEELDRALAGEVLWSGASEQFTTRADAVAALEQHVFQAATDRHALGLYPDAALYASCASEVATPAQDLAQTITPFSCLAVTVETGDHTRSGYTLPAQIDWSTGDLSCG